MLTLQKILCAVDFSESSRVALEHAADLTRRFGAALTLLHVRHLPPALEETGLSERDLGEAGRRELQGKLDTWRAEAERRAERPVQAVLTEGGAAEEIVTTARNEGFDLVVTGTHARKGIRHVLLGSVAERVVREAPCTVVVARAFEERGD